MHQSPAHPKVQAQPNPLNLFSNKDNRNTNAMQTDRTLPPKNIPSHLLKFVKKGYNAPYSSEDQAVWRFVMKQLQYHLTQHGHGSYFNGLEKAGIDVDQIPDIENINTQLNKFGWGAVPVSGFIPPMVFMEFQALGFLPIASEIRTVEHILYTPAPDILHEAAGHAPILVHPDYSSYLQKYSAVAKKAIASVEDVEIYDAIRELSDIKELPQASKSEIAALEINLERLSNKVSYLSEAAQLGRMNWWTAEYGLIGPLDAPKIYGAGLLSSLGESESCLGPNIKKIKLNLDCIKYAYNITEPQPQLFVTPNFEYLSTLLDELSQTMAFNQGGLDSLKKVRLAKTVNTIELNSGLQISGQLEDIILAEDDSSLPIYLKLTGPCQLSFENQQLTGHGKDFHSLGYGTPIGLLKNQTSCMSSWSDAKSIDEGIVEGAKLDLVFKSDVTVSGLIKDILRKNNRIILIAFDECKVTYNDQIFFDPTWGQFDMAVGIEIPSVFGGACDRLAYGEFDQFSENSIPPKELTEEKKKTFAFYQRLRLIREAVNFSSENLEFLIDDIVVNHYKNEWLICLEIEELIFRHTIDQKRLEAFRTWVSEIAFESKDAISCYKKGLSLLGKTTASN